MTTLSEHDQLLLERSYEIAWQSRKNGNHPFGALLADDTGTVFLEAENTVSSTNDLAAHAEVNLLHEAARTRSFDELSRATMFTSAEPCAMCAATAYWVGISRVVYGLSESRLFEIIGPDPENLTLQLDCRTVFAAGQRSVEVIGPTNDLQSVAVHGGFWHP